MVSLFLVNQAVRSLKRTAMDNDLNQQAAIICAFSLAVGFIRRIKIRYII
jgi:hypothetical protein